MAESSESDGDLEVGARCVNCGMCLPTCPTYRELPIETASPRGRVQLIRAMAAGTLKPGPDLEADLDLCLACRACETACPSGVHYGTLIESARAAMLQARRGGEDAANGTAGLLDDLVMRRLFPNPGALKATAVALKLYQMSGLSWLIRRTPLGRLLPSRLFQFEAMMPRVSGWRNLWGCSTEFAPRGEERGRVGFLTGCVMQSLEGDTNLASIEALTRNGFRVLVPSDQCCCGALHLHRGWLEEARAMARRNVAAFEAANVEAVLTNAAGCGSALAEYPRLLAGERDWAARAARFGSTTHDLHAFLVQRGFEPPRGRIAARVVYSDPCHLLHAQKIREQPRQLLRSIPGLELLEAREPELCCGSAGIYNITHTEMSLAILDRKMTDLLSASPDAIVTANPGCLFQLRHGVARAGRDVPVVHVMELLARAYREG